MAIGVSSNVIQYHYIEYQINFKQERSLRFCTNSFKGSADAALSVSIKYENCILSEIFSQKKIMFLVEICYWI